MVAAAEARAVDFGTVFTYQQNSTLYFNPRESEPATFWDRFGLEFNQRAPGVFEDEFSPLSFRNFDAPADYEPNNAGMAMHAFSSAVRSSAEEAVLALHLPIVDWMRDQQGFLADFLWNSSDSVEERGVSPLDPSYRSDERSWWDKLSTSASLRYGVRLFRTDPYAFLSWKIQDRGHVWLLGDARYYYRIFGGQRIELALSTPVVHGLSIEFGTAYQFGAYQPGKKAVLKLLKTFHGGGFLQVALEVRQQPRLTASITMPWW